MSICDNNISGQPFSEEVILEQIKRDYGLSEINNVNGGVIGCVEIFNGPLFTSNFTKLVTGMTETSNGVFNISDVEVYFDYTFTGNTDTLTAYTGNFEYQVYSRTPFSGFTNPDTLDGESEPIDTFVDVLTHSASTSFSDIVSSGLTISSLINSVDGDNEYVFNSNFSFILKDCLYGDRIISENLKNVYDDDYSLYFVTLTNPSTPILGPFTNPEPQTPGVLTTTRETLAGEGETYVFGVPTTVDTSDTNPACQLITETLDIDTTTPDTFVLEYKPYDDTLMLSVNGITLSEIDYTITDNVIITTSKPLDVDKDSITATYLACDRDIDSIKSEVYQITGITSGATSAYTSTEKVYYNTDHSKYEYYVDEEITDVDNTIMYVNGVKLVYGLDFYRSVSVENRLIFNDTTLNVSDTIHVIYNVGDNVEGDYGVVGSGANSFEWIVSIPTVSNDRLGGDFVFEITNTSDKTFSSPIEQTTVIYVDGVTDYSVNVDNTLFDSKTTYLWRVTSNKTYTGLLNNEYITTNVSKIGKFFTNNTINSY
jgi:hypothetical protein